MPSQPNTGNTQLLQIRQPRFEARKRAAFGPVRRGEGFGGDLVNHQVLRPFRRFTPIGRLRGTRVGEERAEYQGGQRGDARNVVLVTHGKRVSMLLEKCRSSVRW